MKIKSISISAFIGIFAFALFSSPTSAQPALVPKKMPIQPASMQTVRTCLQLENNITILSEQLGQVLGAIHNTNTADAYAPQVSQIISQIYAQLQEYDKLPPIEQLSQHELQLLRNDRAANKERIKACGKLTKFHYYRIGNAGFYLSPDLLGVLSSSAGFRVFAYIECRVPLQEQQPTLQQPQQAIPNRPIQRSAPPVPRFQ